MIGRLDRRLALLGVLALLRSACTAGAGAAGPDTVRADAAADSKGAAADLPAPDVAADIGGRAATDTMASDLDAASHVMPCVADTSGDGAADNPVDAVQDHIGDAAGADGDAEGTPAEVIGAADAATPLDAGAVEDAGAELVDGASALGDAPASAPADVTADAAAPLDGAGDVGPGAAAFPDLPPVPPVTPVDPATLPLAAMVDQTASFGIDPAQTHNACVAVADFDGNGREDFVVMESQGWKSTIHAVLLGAGPPKHVKSKFDSATSQANFGCTSVDMNGDGKPDLLVGGFSGLALYLGDGAGGFHNKSDDWLPFFMDFESFSVVPADLDGDGDLDLYIGAGFAPPGCESMACNYTANDLLCTFNPPIPNLPNLQDRVLIQGSQLPLDDATAQWKPPPGGTQTTAMAMDFDGDGKVDVAVADDFGSARILRNTGATFVSYDTNVGLHSYSGAMGCASGDLNHDGLPDLVIAESGPTPVYINSPQWKGTAPFAFVDKGGDYDTWAPNWAASSWSPIIADFDHDGLEDLWVANAANLPVQMTADPKTMCLVSKSSGLASMFKGVPSVDVMHLSKVGGGATAYRVVGGAYAHIILVEQRPIDLDDDGDLDVVQTRPGPDIMTSLVRILRNDLPKKGSSMRVVVQGKGKNQDALGTTVTATIGGKKVTRWLFGSGAFGGTPTRVAHFGLGAASKATAVTVAWPDGTKTLVGEVQAQQTIKVNWP
ncbi:MAG: CRTAC1 family protein [Deltaproteobacteria bacterium]|nr:CRTAC1 family protein [Deltaproteobacteria bacterium]